MIRRLLLARHDPPRAARHARPAPNPTPPAVNTAAASGISANGATITGTVDPNGAATTYEIQYGTSTSYGLRSTTRNAGAGTDPVAVSVPLAGLTPNTVYHYRLVATNAAGVTQQRRPHVSHAGRAPAGRDDRPRGSAHGARAVTVTGTVNPRGRPTNYRFEFGRGTQPEPAHGRTSPPATGRSRVPVAATLTGLLPSTNYSYRLVATNSAGTARSARRTFRTLGECAVLYPSKLSIAARLHRPAASSTCSRRSPRAHRAGRRSTTTRRASTRASTAAIDSAAGRIRFRRSVTSAQARLGTGILTITYPGDGDTRAQTVRLRAAANKARLDLARPQIVNGRIQASGTISSAARGSVRLQLSYQFGCDNRVLELRGTIAGGRWSIDEPLSPQTLTELASRVGRGALLHAVHGLPARPHPRRDARLPGARRPVGGRRDRGAIVAPA